MVELLLLLVEVLCVFFFAIRSISVFFSLTSRSLSLPIRSSWCFFLGLSNQ